MCGIFGAKRRNARNPDELGQHRDGGGPPTSPALRPEVEVLPGPGFPLQLPLVHPDPTMDHAPRRDDVRLDVNGAD
ncbi:hypothetical protein MRX96_055487 [Rhipicephalus microplus]